MACSEFESNLSEAKLVSVRFPPKADLITTEAAIAELPEYKPAIPMGGGGGMGGMGGMDF
jgi:hypothetical protein